MMREPGRRHVWALPGPAGRPSPSGAPDGSGDATLVHNGGDHPAHCEITLFFADRTPVGPYRLRVDAGESMRLRFEGAREDGCRGVLVSDVPVALEPAWDGVAAEGLARPH